MCPSHFKAYRSEMHNGPCQLSACNFWFIETNTWGSGTKNHDSPTQWRNYQTISIYLSCVFWSVSWELDLIREGNKSEFKKSLPRFPSSFPPLIALFKRPLHGLHLRAPSSAPSADVMFFPPKLKFKLGIDPEEKM